MKITTAILCFLLAASVSAAPTATTGYCEGFAAGYVQACVDLSGGTLSQASRQIIYDHQLEICRNEQEQ